jgi:hypothetical protein
MANWREDYEDLHEWDVPRRKVADIRDLDEPETDEDE